MVEESEESTYLTLATQRLYQLFLDKTLYEPNDRDASLNLFSEFISHFEALSKAHQEEGMGSRGVERIIEKYSHVINETQQESMSDTKKEILFLMQGLLRNFHLTIIKSENNAGDLDFLSLNHYEEVREYKAHIYKFYEEIVRAEMDVEYARSKF